MNQDGKLIPSVTRVFHADRDLYVYLQAYTGAPAAGVPASTAPPAPLMAFISFYRDGKKMLEIQPMQVPPVTANRLGTTPVNFRIGMGKLAAGEYQCQVTLLDPAGNRAAFWQGPIMLVN